MADFSILTDDEMGLLYDAVCDRLADYVHHYPHEFVHNGGDLEVYNTLYGKVADECKRRKFWWAR
mgnify:CR=1 FL=1